MLPNDDEPKIGDACTAADFARRRDLHRCIVNSWRTRGYLNKDGERVYIKPRGEALIKGRIVPVYLVSDLAAAELATRPKGGHNRKDPILAWSQEEMRAERSARRTAA